MNNLPPKQSLILITYGVIIGLMMGGVIWLVASPPQGNPITLSTKQSDQLITIFVSGEVLNPGVFQLPSGSRVIDAIEAAGGFLPSADQTRVNQAALLSDSSQINIPSLSSRIEQQDTAININTATEEELQSLPGIGSVTAKNIIDFRLENGPFGSIEEIQKVEGIGPITFEKIKNLIYVGD